jgi:nucleotide-binding universal stress UspA family protein
MKKILVPVDFSKTSIVALQAAFDIAKKDGADIIVLHVVEEATSESYRISGEWKSQNWEDKIFTYRLLEKAKAQLEKLVLEPRFNDVKLVGELRLGNPFHGMNSIISAHKVDLIVMGTKGHTKLEEMIIGTNTQKVVRHAHCPVLTLHKKPNSSSYKDIVYATMMSKDEEVFSRIVRRTQQLYGSTIHLVRINTPGDFQRDKEVKAYMEKFAKKLQLKNYTLNVYNDVSPEEGIINFTDSINGDMIALATHGRTGLAHMMAGSIAENVVGSTTKPVLTFVVRH